MPFAICVRKSFQSSSRDASIGRHHIILFAKETILHTLEDNLSKGSTIVRRAVCGIYFLMQPNT